MHSATQSAVMSQYVFCLSLCEMQVLSSYKLEYFENSFADD